MSTSHPYHPNSDIASTMLAAIIESSDDAIVSKDLNGIVTSWNKSAERIFGYTAEEMVGQPIAILVPADRPNEEPQILERLRRGERVDHFQTVRRRKDGRLIDVSVTISPIRNAEGVIVGASKIARDITDQKRLERELQDYSRQVREQNEELERRNLALLDADRQKNEFLAMLAHELRNPLAPVISSVYLLRAKKEKDPALCDVIERQIRHMSRLLDDLLDISRVNQGKIPLERELVDFGQLVGDAARDLAVLARDRGQTLSLHAPKERMLIMGDGIRLHQVVTNLVSNAVKFTEPGGQIDVTAERNGEEAVLRVRDTGAGIAPELLPHVFGLFVQADQGLARPQGGLGIGLTMVKHLAELHGGRVEAHSAGPGQGAEFVVRLPVLSLGSRVQSPGSDSTGAAPVDPGSGDLDPRLKLLVVDDNVDAADTLAELASLWGHRTSVAHDGITALKRVQDECPDVVLLDLGMPGMDGYVVAETLRRDQPTCAAKLIAVSGYGQQEDRRRTQQAGFDHHLVKPVEPETLRRLLWDICPK